MSQSCIKTSKKLPSDYFKSFLNETEKIRPRGLKVCHSSNNKKMCKVFLTAEADNVQLTS